MSDIAITISVAVFLTQILVLVMHSALKHRRLVSMLTYWTFFSIFVITIGGVLLLGTFNPSAADSSNQIFRALAWGQSGYDVTTVYITTFGTIIYAMGLGILIMTVLRGIFPRSFSLTVKEGGRPQTR